MCQIGNMEYKLLFSKNEMYAETSHHFNSEHKFMFSQNVKYAETNYYLNPEYKIIDSTNIKYAGMIKNHILEYIFLVKTLKKQRIGMLDF